MCVIPISYADIPHQHIAAHTDQYSEHDEELGTPDKSHSSKTVIGRS